MRSALVVWAILPLLLSAACSDPTEAWTYEPNKACKLSSDTIVLTAGPAAERVQRARICVTNKEPMGAAISTELAAPVMCAGEPCLVRMQFDGGADQFNRALGYQGPVSASFIFIDGAFVAAQVAKAKQLEVWVPDDRGKTQRVSFRLSSPDWSKAK